MDYNLGSVDQIPMGQRRNFKVGEGTVAIFRSRSGIFATQAACPHRQGPLADGLIGGTTIVCPLHGWKFSLTSGDPILGECGLAVYPVRISDCGEIMLSYEHKRDRSSFDNAGPEVLV